MSEVKTNKITSLASNNDITLAPDGTGAIKIGDSTELVFGDGSDFKISHNGSKTKLEDIGTGNLEIRGTNIEFYSGDGGETLAKLTDDGAAELYHNNTKRIETTSTGVEVGDSSGGQVTFRYTGNSGFSAIKADSSNNMLFSSGVASFAERMRIATDRLLIGKTSTDFSTAGFRFDYSGEAQLTRAGAEPINMNRTNNDGKLIRFFQDASEEGSISVSGTTVTLNGGHLSRWSRLSDGSRPATLLRGTVMSNLDDMIVWSHDAVAATYYEQGDEMPEGVSVGDEKTPAVAAYTEDNEQLNHTKVSDTEGDANVAGVFVAWDDDDDDFEDYYLGMTGDMVIRIAQGTTVARGDLLMSAGDGTAKPQGDDIVRSKTIAKVTSTTKSHTYDDGSYLVPCVLMAC